MKIPEGIKIPVIVFSLEAALLTGAGSDIPRAQAALGIDGITRLSCGRLSTVAARTAS